MARQGKDDEGTSIGLDLASSVPANRREKKVSLTQSQVKKSSKLAVIVDIPDLLLRPPECKV